MSKYDIHPAANIFPMMSDAAYQSLKADMEKNGQCEAVVLYDGKLVDGRNRLRACEELGIEPLYSELEPDVDPVAFVLSANLHRRQLKTSQKAMCAAKLAGLGEGRPSKTGSNDTVLPIDEAAKLFGVGRASVCRALDVLRDGCKQLAEMCESGEVPVSLASTFIKETADKKTQGRIAKGGKAAIVADMKSSDEPVEAAVDPGEDFDVDARGDRLCDWLRHELDQWPQEHLGEALHWIVQIATKEFKA